MLDGMPRHIELPARGSLSQHPSPLPTSAFAHASLTGLPPTPSDLAPGAPLPSAAFPHQLPANGVLLPQGSTDSSNFASAAGAIRIPLLPMGSGGLSGTVGGGGGAAGVALLSEAFGPLPPRRGSSNGSAAVPPVEGPSAGKHAAGGDGGTPGDPGGNGGGTARRRPPPLVVAAPASGTPREEGAGTAGAQDAADAATGAVAQSGQEAGGGEAGAAAAASVGMRRPHLPPLPPPQRPNGASSSSSLGAGSGGGGRGALSASGSRQERVSGSGAGGGGVGSDATSEADRTSAGAQPQRPSNSGGVRTGHMPLPPLPPLLTRGPSGGNNGSAHPLPPLMPSSSSLRARGSDHSGPTTPTFLTPTPGSAFLTQHAPSPGAPTPPAQPPAGGSPDPGTSVSLSLSLGDPARPLLRLPGAADLNSPAGTPPGAFRTAAPADPDGARRSLLGQSLPLDADSVPLLGEGAAEAEAAAAATLEVGARLLRTVKGLDVTTSTRALVLLVVPGVSRLGSMSPLPNTMYSSHRVIIARDSQLILLPSPVSHPRPPRCPIPSTPVPAGRRCCSRCVFSHRWRRTWPAAEPATHAAGQGPQQAQGGPWGWRKDTVLSKHTGRGKQSSGKAYQQRCTAVK